MEELRIKQCCSYAAFVILLCQFHSFAAAVITVPPVSKAIPQGTTTTFTCIVEQGLGFWMINGTWVLPSVDFSPYGFTIAIDQDDDGASMSLQVEGRASNNNTRITCVSVDTQDASVSSVEARLTIAGPPAAPKVSFQLLNATALAFSWEKPFSFDNVSDILYYTVRVSRRGSRQEWTVRQSSETSFTHVVTSDVVVTSCEQVVFEVSATSVAGTSPTQSVSGGFPIVPTVTSKDQPGVNTRTTANGMMTAEVIFQLPNVCPYQAVKYTLYVRQLSIGSLAQNRQIELIADGKQAIVSTVVTGLSSNVNTYFTILVQTVTGELQFSKIVAKQNLPVLKLALSAVVKGNAVTVYPKPTVAVESMFCRVLNFPFQNCSSGQFTFSGLPDGKVTIQAVAKSGSEVVTNNVTLWVNQNNNFCGAYLNNNMVTVIGGDVSVEFTSSGRPSSYSCSVDAKNYVPCSSPFHINLQPGRHVVQIVPRCENSQRLDVDITVV